MENNNTEEGVKGDNKLMVPASIIVAGLMIAGAVIYVSGPRSAPNPPGGNIGDAGPKANVAEVLKIKGNDRVLGNPGAKVVIIEYADFQCPFCGKFYKEVEKKIVESYIKTGNVAFVYRDFAFLGEESMRSAEASKCANEQGKFWEYHDYLFMNQNGENQGAFSDINLKSFAKILKLDSVAFDKCFDSGKYKQEIEASAAEGRAIGVTGTPATFVNGILISGAQPFSVFQGKIEAELKK